MVHESDLYGVKIRSGVVWLNPTFDEGVNPLSSAHLKSTLSSGMQVQLFAV